MSARHWNDLVPVDRYIVRSNGLIHEYDRKILTMLYQPLLGFRGFSLYMTLWSELEQDRLWGEDKTHHSLMAMMQCNLKDIHHERQKLEGIGLLRTYVNEKNDARNFIYEIQPPLTPDAFFSDPVLNIYLYNRLSKSKYLNVKKFFTEDKLINEQYEQVTKSFNDVFQSIQAEQMVGSLNDEAFEDISITSEKEWMNRAQGTEPVIKHTNFDFELLFAGLSDVVIPNKAITTKVKDAIEKLSFLYQIDALQMKDILMNTIDEDDNINIEKLRKSSRDWYQLEYNNELPTLVETTQPFTLRKMENKEPTSKDEQLIKMLETVSPRKLLSDLSNGGEPIVSDLQIVEDIMFKQHLPAGVINVLLYYVLLKTDMKLNRKYIEKIASHWARKHIKTVPDAMELAKQEQRQYQSWAETKSSTKTPAKKTENRNRFISKEQKITEEKNESTTTAQEEDKRKLAERLERLKLQKKVEE
ncbi:MULTISPECIES: replication initiation and membrane attachment family protein [Bacillus]|uniref:replication initiation and membrane attachment family protein n=1 Tax=Bacillus TaxID=1386 RepID=UPI000BB8941F|nr:MULTISPECIES: DnaD domain protein [Bacillus]